MQLLQQSFCLKAMAFLTLTSDAVSLSVGGAQQPDTKSEATSLLREFATAADENLQDDDLAGTPTEVLAAIMAEADSNKDGQLTWGEILAHAKTTRNRELEEAKTTGSDSEVSMLAWDAQSEADLRKLVDDSDADKNGFISLEELRMLEHEPAEVDENQEDQNMEHEEGAASLEEEQGEEVEEADEDKEGEEGEEEGEPQAASLLETGSSEEGMSDDSSVDKDLAHFLSEVDTDRDNKLSLAEVRALIAKGAGADLKQDFGFNLQKIEDSFKAGDWDSDGFLNTHELVALHDEREENLREEGSLIEGQDEEADSQHAIEQTFRFIDSDKDGKVSWNDVRAKVVEGADVTKMEADFIAADVNKDSILSDTEFNNFASNLIQRLGDAAGEQFLPVDDDTQEKKK